MRRKCIKCNKLIKKDAETGVLIKGVELLSYAHHKSEHDYGHNFNPKVVLFCICDECYKIELKKGLDFVKRQRGEIARAGKV